LARSYRVRLVATIDTAHSSSPLTAGHGGAAPASGSVPRRCVMPRERGPPPPLQSASPSHGPVSLAQRGVIRAGGPTVTRPRHGCSRPDAGSGPGDWSHTSDWETRNPSAKVTRMGQRSWALLIGSGWPSTGRRTRIDSEAAPGDCVARASVGAVAALMPVSNSQMGVGPAGDASA
jgi:hypothetical protein